MLRFAARRLLSMVFVLFAVSVIVFLLFFVTPGVDPAARIAGRNADPATLAAVRHSFGLDQPLPVQYVIMMKKLFISQDLSSFVNRGELVTPQIVAATPVTLSLVVGAAVIWVIFAILVGIVAAAWRGRFIDPLLMALALVGVSIPVFWLGEVTNLITQDRLHSTLFSWVPGLGYTPITTDPWMWFKQMLFPWITLAVGYIGIYSRVLRSSMVDALSEDFIRTARAKGLTERRVLLRHALRTSMIVFVSLFGLDFAALVGGGALLTEVVFGLPGVGQLTYTSTQNLDLPVILAVAIYAAFFVVFANALVDLTYAWLDPRVRHA
jgi:peptide/nickel transport system permease protein